MTDRLRFASTDRYIATRDLEVAVNAAVALERPLLAKGEPGTGKTVLAEEVARAPKLITLFAHRYLPAEPCEAGNPVFSVYQSDVIYYGANLQDWLRRELGGWDAEPWPPIKRIRFWSDAEERNG